MRTVSEDLGTHPSQAGAQKDESNHRDGETGSGSEIPGGDAPPKEANPPFSLVHEIAFVAIICSAQLLTQAGFAQAIVPLQIIGESFGALSPGQLSWFTAAYSLTVGTFILIAGRLGDNFGHKILFITGFVWYALWSLVAGLSVYSRSYIFLDVCRALQGIGPALLLPNALAILGRTYPPGRRKNMVFSLFGATAPNGFLVGAVFSALLSQRVWWPWVSTYLSLSLSS